MSKPAQQKIPKNNSVQQPAAAPTEVTPAPGVVGNNAAAAPQPILDLLGNPIRPSNIFKPSKGIL